MPQKKVFNDPVYGFVSLGYPILFELVEHPYFQRLRRIQQLGLTHLVYPGALHTRFQHAIGAVHLTNLAIEVLRSKEIEVTDQEAEAVSIAILLHDIGHGPVSHTLEHSLVKGLSHEHLSKLFMEKLNEEFEGHLELAINVFEHRYNKHFLSQLVSGQLDLDRMDYLNRDSFFTGVFEGVIGYDRIIKMLNVHKGKLVVDAKGTYSVENFIIARRLMYWQVYLHKTVIAAEEMLIKAMKRARGLAKTRDLGSTPALSKFLSNDYSKEDFEADPELLNAFAQLDDSDIFASLKSWAQQSDKVLSFLASSLLDRKLLKVQIQNEAFKQTDVDKLKADTAKSMGLNEEEVGYFVFTNTTTNSAYSMDGSNINILFKDGSVRDIAEASDQLNISVLTEPVVKHYLCYPKLIEDRIYHKLGTVHNNP